jgi:hypothetical protein
MSVSNGGYFEVLWPRGEHRAKPSALASRPATLNGKRIAFIWDYLFKGDQIFAQLEGAIRERFPNAEFVHWSEFGNTHGPDERAIVAALPQRLKDLRVDAAISGMGC